MKTPSYDRDDIKNISLIQILLILTVEFHGTVKFTME